MKLKAQKRQDSSPKSIRNDGGIPAVFYGPDTEGANSIRISKQDFLSLFKEVGESQIFDLEVEGDDTYQVLVHDYQLDPIYGDFTHVDFYHVSSDKKLTTHIEVNYEGTPPVEKRGEGLVVINYREIEIEALPEDLPSEVVVDVSGLEEVGDEINISDLNLGEGVEILMEPETSLVSVVHKRTEEELEALEEEAVADVTEVEGVVKEEEMPGEEVVGEEEAEEAPTEEEEVEELEQEAEE